MRKIKFILIAGGSLLGVFALGLALFVGFGLVNSQELQEKVLAYLEAQTGVMLKVNGPLTVKVGLLPQIEFEDLQISFDPVHKISPWRAQKGALQLKLWPLFKKQVHITQFEIEHLLPVETNDKEVIKHVQGKIRIDPQKIAVKALKVDSKWGTLKGQLKFDLGIDPLTVSGHLTLDPLKISADSSTQTNWKIPLMPLKGQVDLHISSIEGENVPIKSITSTVKLSPKVMHFKPVDIQLDNGGVNGDLKINLENQTVVGQLSSSKLSWAPSLGSGGVAKTAKAPAFLGFPLDTKIEFKVDQLIWGTHNFQAVNGALNLTKSRALMEPLSFSYLGSPIKGKVDIKRTRHQVNSQIAAKSTHVNLEKMMTHFFKKGSIKVQTGEFDVSLQGPGLPGESWLSQARGYAYFKMDKGELLNTQLNTSASDFLFGFLNLLNPFSSKKASTPIHCAHAFLSVDQGKAHAKEGIAVQTGDIHLLGDGSIDLKNKQLDLDLTLEPASKLNLKLVEFAREIKVTGPLERPKFTPSAMGLIKEGGSLVALVASGGLSLVAEKALEVTLAKRNICKSVHQQYQNRGQPKAP